MKENDVLYFEEDDASELGINGKQVFMTKRINGKTSRNKASNKENKVDNSKKSRNLKDEKKSKTQRLEEEESLAYNEIIIGIDKLYFPEGLTTKQENKKNKKNNSNSKRASKSKQTSKKEKSANSKSKKISKNKSSKSPSSTKIKKAYMDTNFQNNEETYRRKTPKKKKKKKRILKILILLVIIIGTIVFALVSPTFNIQTITVQGNTKISTETIISLSQLQTGENIFRNLKSEIINNIKEEPYINSVEIKRVLPGTIEITVEERSVAYQIQVIDSYVYIDYQGYILEKSSEQDDVPILAGMATSQNELLNEKRLVSDDITKLNVILKIVENAKKLDIYDLITQINTENDEYILYLESEKKYIYLGNGSNIVNKMMYAQIIIENEKGNSGKIMINGDLDNGFNPYFSEEEI